MKKIISISGFGGSGKTACANLLWDHLENAAIVEADQFFRIKPFDWMTKEGLGQIGRIKLQMSIALTKSFCEEKFENIIIDGLVWSQAELDEVAANAKKYGYETWCFWLETKKETRHKRALDRKRDEADSQQFLDTVEQLIKDPTPLSLPGSHYHEIKTDGLSAAKVADRMLAILG